MRKFAFCFLIMGLSSCAPTVWHREDGSTDQIARSQFARDEAVCKGMARASQSASFALGSPAFVVGWMAGSIIGNAAVARDTYHDCMVGSGYIEEGTAQ